MAAASDIKTEPQTRNTILEQIKQAYGESDTTEILIEYIMEMWETIDLLHHQFGKERAQAIIAMVTHCDFLPDGYPHT